MRTILRTILLSLACFITGCAQFGENSTGLVMGQLTPCPSWPRCVSSISADAERQVEPFQLQQPFDAHWNKAIATLAAMPRTRIVTRDERYVHTEVTSPWGVYTDDLEMLLDPGSGRVDVRSSARIGYYDFEVNRERVETLREALAAKGLTNQP